MYLNSSWYPFEVPLDPILYDLIPLKFTFQWGCANPNMINYSIVWPFYTIFQFFHVQIDVLETKRKVNNRHPWHVLTFDNQSTIPVIYFFFLVMDTTHLFHGPNLIFTLSHKVLLYVQTLGVNYRHACDIANTSRPRYFLCCQLFGRFKQSTHMLR